MPLKKRQNENEYLIPNTLVKGCSGSAGIHRQLPRRRSRAFSTNSLGIYNEDEDMHIISTSFGTALVHLDSTPGLAWDWYLGLFLGFFSGVLFTANNFCIKFFSLDPVEMLLVRSILQAFLLGASLSLSSKLSTSSGWLTSLKQTFVPQTLRDQLLVSIQGILGGLRVFLFFGCLPYIPLGDALTLVFTEPLWTLILSKLILRTRIGLWKILFGLFLVPGVILCVKPPFLFPNDSIGEIPIDNSSATVSGNLSVTSVSGQFGEESGISRSGTNAYFLGVGLAICAAVTGSFANILIAKCDMVTSSVFVFYSGIAGVIIALIFSTFYPHNRFVSHISLVPLHDWILLLGLGSTGMIGYFCLTRALQLIPPTTVAVLRSMEIVLAYLVEALVMGNVPDILSISGSTFVGVSVIAVAFEDQIKSILKLLFVKINKNLSQFCFSRKKDSYSEI